MDGDGIGDACESAVGVHTIFENFDDAGATARWEVPVRTFTGGGSSSERNPLTGGVPAMSGGASGYREGSHSFTNGGSVNVLHILKHDPLNPGKYSYDPANGIVDSIVVSMDRIVLQVPSGGGVGTIFLLRQGTSIYQALTDPPTNGFTNLTWQGHSRTYVQSSFTNGTPTFNSRIMEFGFLRSNTTGATTTIIWGVDNFRVLVYHR